jgi:hypothetical protein
MYFVDKALHQIQPYLSSILGGQPNVRVITIGYEMPSKDGWEPSWAERVLGLTIFRYDMENVTKFPSDWKSSSSVDDDDDDDGGKEEGRGTMDKLDNHIRNSSNNESDVEEFLRRKRQEDMEELNRGLRIHHDEELDEFAHARTKKLLGDHSNINASTIVVDDDDESAWEDFDETEDPEELMKEAQRKMMEVRKASRGNMMAGIGQERKKKSSKDGTSAAAAPTKNKPTWKKP